MTSHILNISDLTKRYKAAKNKDEDIKDLTTKKDLLLTEERLETKIHKEKFSAIAWILTGIWAPIIIACIAKYLGA